MPEPRVFRDRLIGKTAMVTGAGAEGEDIGIGRAIALLFAHEGARVACIDLDHGRVAATADMITKTCGQAIALSGDVTVPDDCAKMVDATVSAFGDPQILVNNVGLGGSMTLENASIESWRAILDTNLTSAMLMAKYAVPRMAAAGGGSIINISSISGMRAMGALAYGPSKAALHQLSREIGVLHGRQGIRANTVAPGHMMTPMAMRHVSPKMRETRRKISPLGVEGDAWDIAQAVLFLASDESRFVNGVQLAVDGGVEGIAPLTGLSLLSQD